MSDVLYDQGRLNAAVRHSDQCARTRPQKKVCEAAGGLEVTHSIPRELYYNATVGHGVDPSDTGYWKDMERVVPSIKVNSTSGRRLVGPLHRHRGPVTEKNRFGRVTSRKVYR